MKIILTAREIMDKRIWSEFCELRHISEWAIAEGQMDDDERFEFSEEEAIKLGLIRR